MPLYTVTYKNLETETKHTVQVEGPFKDQEEAEAHVSKLPKSKGGFHWGIEVIPKEPPPAEQPATEQPAQ